MNDSQDVNCSWASENWVEALSVSFLSDLINIYLLSGQMEFPEIMKISRIAQCKESKHFKDSNDSFDNRMPIKTSLLCSAMGNGLTNFPTSALCSKTIDCRKLHYFCWIKYRIRDLSEDRVSSVVIELSGKNQRGRSFNCQMLQFSRTTGLFLRI